MIDTSHPINDSDFSVVSVHTSLSTSSTIRCHESTIPTIAGINGKIHSSWVVLHLHGVWWSCLSGMFWVQQLGDMDLWWKKAWTQPTETVGTWSFFLVPYLNLSRQLCICGIRGQASQEPSGVFACCQPESIFFCRILVSKNGTFQGILWEKGEIKRWWIFKHQHLPTLAQAVSWCSPGLSLSKHR